MCPCMHRHTPHTNAHEKKKICNTTKNKQNKEMRDVNANIQGLPIKTRAAIVQIQKETFIYHTQAKGVSSFKP